MICHWTNNPIPCYAGTDESKCGILTHINESDIPEEDKQRLKKKCPGLVKGERVDGLDIIGGVNAGALDDGEQK